MMNKSLRARRPESSRKRFYGFQCGDEGVPKRTTALPAAFAKKNSRRTSGFCKKRAAVSGGF
jgi:hypothetical protein